MRKQVKLLRWLVIGVIAAAMAAVLFSCDKEVVEPVSTITYENETQPGIIVINDTVVYTNYVSGGGEVLKEFSSYEEFIAYYISTQKLSDSMVYVLSDDGWIISDDKAAKKVGMKMLIALRDSNRVVTVKR